MKMDNKEAIEFEKTLIDKGYIKYNETLNGQEYTFWKTIYEDEKDEYGDKVFKYMIGYDKFDFSKYNSYNGLPISFQQKCYITDSLYGERVKMTKTIGIDKFESYCADYYEFCRHRYITLTFEDMI